MDECTVAALKQLIDLGSQMDTVVAVLKELADLGLVESGREPDSAGVTQFVWRLLPHGQLVLDYAESFGLTLEQALAVVAEMPPTGYLPAPRCVGQPD